jgi:hypothetical protein
MDIKSYNVVELTVSEHESIAGGGGIGRVVGWILGLPELYMNHCKKHPEMSEVLMNCM